MSNDQKVDVKISTEKFDVKKLEIIDGHLEITLSAKIAESTLEESSLVIDLNNEKNSVSAEPQQENSADSLPSPTFYEPPAEQTPVEPPQYITEQPPIEQTSLPEYNASQAEEPSDTSAYVEETTKYTPEVNDQIAAEEEDFRYGEPDTNIEWQAADTFTTVNVEQAVVSEYQAGSEDTAEPPASDEIPEIDRSTTEQTAEVDDNLSISPVDELPEYLGEEIEPPAKSSISEQTEYNSSANDGTSIPLATPSKKEPLPSYLQEPSFADNNIADNNSNETEDPFPDYLRTTEPELAEPKNVPEYLKKTSEPDSTTKQSEIKEETPTPIEHIAPVAEQPVIGEKPPAITPPITPPKIEPKKQKEDQPEPVMVKKVKFICPKCKTPGSQPIDKIGSIIACSNCGRAMKLNIKK